MPKGRILAIDYGQKNIGLALSDEMQIIAQGIPTIANTGDDIFKTLTALVRENNIVEIAVGMPLNMNGTKSQQTEAVEAFCEKLKNEIPIPVHAVDERLTTRQAERMLIDSGVSRRKRKKVNDRVAAQLILQNYLSIQANKPLSEDEE